MSEQTATAEDAWMTLRSLASGKPPVRSSGDRFLFGRAAELALFERDLHAVASGRSAIRLIVGEHGAGKSALLDETLHRARKQRFITMRADLSRECLLWGRDGEARSLLEQALLSMRSLGSGERCAIDSLVGAFRDESELISAETGVDPAKVHRHRLASLGGLPRGYDFMQVLGLHGQALLGDDELSASKARRWLLTQHRIDRDARREVGVPAISDADQWSTLKLWASFARLSGRPGLVVVLDEARTLATLPKPARDANYRQLFHMFNEILGDGVAGLALYIAVTPAMLSGEFDSLCSEVGLNSCLHSGRLAGCATDPIDCAALLLAELDEPEIEAMLLDVRRLIGQSQPEARLIPVSDLTTFIERSRDQLGGQRYPLPRDMIRKFLTLHNQLAANPSLQWSDVLRRNVQNEPSVAAIAASSGQFAERLM